MNVNNNYNRPKTTGDILKVLSLFDGLSGARIVLDRLGIPCDYFASEVDKYAMKISQKNYPDIEQLGDVRNITGKAIGKIDLLIGGSPCFAGDSLVTTINGLKEIRDVVIGDYVLTHNNNFQKVIKITCRMSGNIYRIKNQGCFPIVATGDHLFYNREMYRKYDYKKRSSCRIFKEPNWKKVCDFNKNDFVGFAINQLEENKFNLTKEECWIIGRYVADGYLRNNKRLGRKNSYNHQIILCIGKHKINNLKENIKTYYVGYSEEKTVYKARIINQRLCNLCYQCGKGAENKIIPGFIMNLPNDLLEMFLEGYISGDGSNDKKNNITRASSVSKKLILQLSQVIHKLYGTVGFLSFSKKKSICIIENRIVNQKNSYSIGYSKYSRKQDNYKKIDNNIWTRFMSFEKINIIIPVYNLEVEKDNSYVVNNCIVHNCQDVSIAKRNREDLHGKQSGLFYELLRLLNEINPRYFLIENVASMKASVKEEISNLLGVQPILINSALVTAQQRKRLYWTNIPGIKQPEDRHIYLKDILEFGYTEKEKSYCLNASYDHAVPYDYFMNGLRQYVFNKPVCVVTIGKGGQGERVYFVDGKSICLSVNGGGRDAKTGLYLFLNEIKPYIRKLMPIECERLQGLPDNYTEGVSDTQRYKMLGNGFTIPVIEHILSYMDIVWLNGKNNNKDNKERLVNK